MIVASESTQRVDTVFLYVKYDLTFFLELDTDLQNYAKGNHSQAETVDYLTEKLGSLLLQDILEAEKKRANQQGGFQN